MPSTCCGGRSKGREAGSPLPRVGFADDATDMLPSTRPQAEQPQFLRAGVQPEPQTEADRSARPCVRFVESTEDDTPQVQPKRPSFEAASQEVGAGLSSTAQPRVGFAEGTTSASVQLQAQQPGLAAKGMPEPKLAFAEAASQLDDSSPTHRSKLKSLRNDSAVERAAAAEDEFLSPGTRRKRVVLVAGAPCTGKGTQCDLIVGKYGLVHINPGEILREHVRRDTHLGRRAAPFMERGELVPTDVVLAIVEERLSRPDVTSRGCVLNNFPLTAEQAEAMQSRIHVDLFIELEVPRSELVERARGRRIDPHTGSIYHTRFHPPPPEVAGRLEHRSDDAESLVEMRLRMYDLHVAEITPWFESVRYCVQGDRPQGQVFSSIAALLDDNGWGATEASPYIGSKAFGGAFSSTDARRGGFFSVDEPPDEGDEVACFQRGDNFRKQGIVVAVDMLESCGECGLLSGLVGAWITVRYEIPDGISDSTYEFQTWAEYLAPVNDMEYSSICSTRKFLTSNYRRLCQASPTDLQQLPAPVPVERAKTSLKLWLENLVDSDGEPVALKPGMCDELVQVYASRTAEQSPSLYLYSTDTTIAPRISSTLGLDYSKYYRALNNTLNHDSDGEALRSVIPLVAAMTHDLCCYADGTPRRFEQETRVWKGDAQRPVPLNRQRLREAFELRSVIRFRQFQSATSDEKLASKCDFSLERRCCMLDCATDNSKMVAAWYCAECMHRYRKREESKGFLWTIDIPAGFFLLIESGFVGARDISDVAWRARESETLFPPYSAFLVVSVSEDGCHLLAVDKATELGENASRHGLNGTRRHQTQAK